MPRAQVVSLLYGLGVAVAVELGVDEGRLAGFDKHTWEAANVANEGKDGWGADFDLNFRSSKSRVSQYKGARVYAGGCRGQASPQLCVVLDVFIALAGCPRMLWGI